MFLVAQIGSQSFSAPLPEDYYELPSSGIIIPHYAISSQLQPQLQPYGVYTPDSDFPYEPEMYSILIAEGSVPIQYMLSEQPQGQQVQLVPIDGYGWHGQMYHGLQILSIDFPEEVQDIVSFVQPVASEIILPAPDLLVLEAGSMQVQADVAQILYSVIPLS